MSVKSSELNKEELIKKRQNERFAFILGIFTQFLWAVNGVQMKTFRLYFPNNYTDNSVMFWRMLPPCIIGYIICKYTNIHIQSFSELKHLNWFLCRNALAYLFIIAWIKMYSYFRVSTITVIGGTTPILIIIISVFLIGEKFYIRYLLGVFLCIFGSAIIILNDRKPESKAQILNDNLFVGILLGITNVTLVALSLVGQKVLTKEGMDIHLQAFYFASFNVVPAFIFGILTDNIFSSNWKYIMYVMSNGFLFYTANYFNTLCLRYIAISKFQPITYLCIVFTFIISAIFLGEPVFFSDLIGALIIIGFQYYNFVYPPGKKISEIPEKESNIKQ
jgi:drug/metabolite transporter (DMT)-like permease